nr:retrotransposon protein, putative, unclassified [Tanacetum cinerariifolium]
MYHVQCTKASDNADQARKETKPVKDYILLQLWTADPPFSRDPKKKGDNVNSTNNVNTVSSTVNAAGTNEDNEFSFDPNMPTLEDVSTFNFSNNDEDDDIVADMNNMDTTIQVSHILTTRVHKDHPLDQVIGDLHSATQTRQILKNLKEHGTQKGNSCIERSKLDRGYAGKASTVQVTRSLDFSEFTKWKKGYRKIEKEVYVCQPPGFEDPDFPNRVYKVENSMYGLHQAPRAWYETLSTYLLDNGFYRGKIDKTLFIKRHKEVKNASTPMETHKPLLKDEDGEEVDAHMYMSMIGSLMYLTFSRPNIMFAVCACARYQVNLKTQKPKKPKRKVTEVPQPSEPTEHVADEAVYKELADRLATPNEASSPRTTLGGGPRCQEAMKDTIAQTRFKTASKLSNDSLLARARVDSSKDDQSLGDDASKQGRKIHDIDADEDITLVNDQDDAEMFDVNDLHGEEVFVKKEVVDKEVSAAGEVNAASIATTVSAAATITTDEITLAQALVEIKISKPKAKGILQAKLQAEFDEEQRLAQERARKELETNIALIKEWDDIQAKINKVLCSKKNREKRNKPPTQAQQRKIMCTYLKNMEEKKLTNLKNKSFDSIKKMFDRAFNRVNTFVDFKTELVEGSSKRAGEELELKKLMEIIPDEEDVAIDDIPLAVKYLKIVDGKIHKEGKKSYYQIIRADRNSKMYMVFNRMLKEFEREDLKDLYNLVKAKYRSTKPVEDLDLLLWVDLKTMFEPHVEDQVWKKKHRYKVLEWKLYDFCGVHSLKMQSVHIYMLVEMKYPLTTHTLTYVLNKKLQANHFTEMAY